MPVCSKVVHLPQDEHKVVRVDKAWKFWGRSLYVGIRSEIPRPPAKEQLIEAEWSRVVNEDLSLHLRNINDEIQYTCQGRNTKETILEPELLLTGQQLNRSISLSPKIWFRCGSAWTEKIVRKEMNGLSWMAARGLGDRIETGLESAILVSEAAVPVPKQLLSLLNSELQPTFELPYGYTLYVCTQKLRDSASAHGLLCSVLVKKNGEVKHHSICRIGGLITVHDALQPRAYAVTSAHGLLDYFLSASAKRKAENVHKYSQMAENALNVATSLVSTSRNFFFGTEEVPPEKKAQHISAHGTLSNKDLDNVEWEPVQSVHSTNWLGGGWEIGKEFQHPFFIADPEKLAPDADFALLELSPETHDILNQRKADESSMPHITGWLEDHELDSGAVQVIVGGCDMAIMSDENENTGEGNRRGTKRKHSSEPQSASSKKLKTGTNSASSPALNIDSPKPNAAASQSALIPAELLHERPHLFLRGAPFPTRKLRLSQPLASGTSGAWVVRGEGLCGMIVASYETEPFAHMITAEKLLSDIKKTLGYKLIGQPMIGLPIRADRGLLHARSEVLSSDHEAEGPSNIRAAERLDNASKENLTAILQPSHRIDTPIDETNSTGLRQRLYEALVVSSHQSRKFMPLRSLTQILARSAVQNSLQQSFSDSAKVDQLMDYIFGSGTQSLKIYGTLVLLGKAQDISKFVDGGINDSDLPFHLTAKRSEEVELQPATGDDGSNRQLPPPFLMEWPYTEIDLFNNYQWYFLSPYFSSDPAGSILHYSLHDDVILPWTEMEVNDEAVVSTVQKVKIHPFSHDFPYFDRPNTFAVKLHPCRNLEDFTHEVDILKRLRKDSPYLVNLCATFKYRGFYHMIFPWSSGGSLYDFWRRCTAAPPLETSLHWLLHEAENLARGLGALHYPVDGQSILHGDLKPDNILLSRDLLCRGGIGWTLKIANFGCASIIRQEDPRADFSFSRTYRAPEIDQTGPLYMTPEYDIWTLGCLFLEFLGWVLMGTQGLVDFTNSRLAEEQLANGSLHEYAEDKFFFGKTRSDSDFSSGDFETCFLFEIKDSVRKYMKRLSRPTHYRGIIKGLLDLIQGDMLVVDPKKRLSAKAIIEKILVIKEVFELERSISALSDVESSQDEEAQLNRPKIAWRSGWESFYFDIPRKHISLESDEADNRGAQRPNKNKVLQPIDIKTIDELIAETSVQDATQLPMVRRTVEQRHFGNMQDTLRQMAMLDGGKRYETYRNDYSTMERAELNNVKIDSFARIAAADHVMKSGQVNENEEIEIIQYDTTLTPAHSHDIPSDTLQSLVPKAGGGKASGKSGLVKKQRAGLNLACPFRKRNPIRFNVREFERCALRSYVNMASLKKHLLSDHHKPTPSWRICNRCQQSFEDQNDAITHFHECPGFLPPERTANLVDPEEGFDDEIKKRLVSRKDSQKIDAWDTLYRLLFPGSMIVPDLHFDPVREDHELYADIYARNNRASQGNVSAFSITRGELER